MTEPLPQPPVPPDTDLRDFAYMPLDVVRLRDSDLAALAAPEEFRSAVMLWCASWHQIPAASVPDDDKILANLAGFGRGVTDWKRVRDGALRGWVKCSDGRLYHPVVAEKANEAVAGKHRNAHKKLCERLRKAGLKGDGIPSFEQWKSDGMPMDDHYRSNGTDGLFQRKGDGSAPPSQRNVALKGIGERGEGEDRKKDPVPSEPTGSASPLPSPGDGPVVETAVATMPTAGATLPLAPPDDMPEIPLALMVPEHGDWRKLLFRQGLEWIARATSTAKRPKLPDDCRALVGNWLRTAQDDARLVFEIVADAQKLGVVAPVPWITAAIAQRAGTSGQQAAVADLATLRANAERWAESNT